MRHEIIECDCCQKNNIGTAIEVKIPIITKNLKNGKEYLTEKEMDLCVDCANEFARLYYKIANENGGTGMRGII